MTDQNPISTVAMKICADKGKDYTATEYSNAQGEIGGYVLTPDSEIDDGAPSLYDAAGTWIATGTMFATQEKREAFTAKMNELIKNFPIKKDTLCS